MLRKKEVYTVVTPIPGFIPRQLALDILHSHSEVITLNPLVLSHRPIAAPRDAAADEFYSTWYEVTERVQVLPGAGKFGSSKITFNGCFHDMPWGLQTHTYAPFNIDLRIKYRVAGNQPGLEAPEIREMGLEQLGAPQDGLYLREDIEIRCNITMVSFVKAQLKAASKEMVQRIIRKAELLDSGVLQAMMQDGKLKTINPNDRSEAGQAAIAAANARPLSPSSYGPSSPRPYMVSPTLSSGHMRSDSTGGRNNYHGQQRPDYRNSYQGSYPQQTYQSMTPPPAIPPKEQISSPQPMELPGDFQYTHPPPPQQPPQYQPSQQPYPQQQSPPYGQQQQQHPSPSPALHPSHAGFAPHHWPGGQFEPPKHPSPNQQQHWQPQPSPTSTSSAYGGNSSTGQPSPGFTPSYMQQQGPPPSELSSDTKVPRWG